MSDSGCGEGDGRGVGERKAVERVVETGEEVEGVGSGAWAGWEARRWGEG